MKNERAAFAERLRKGLKAGGFDVRPVELVKLLARYGVSVTQQAISGWLGGKHMPKQNAMRALSRIVGMDPRDLQYGGATVNEVRELRTAWPDHLSGRDRLLFEDFLALPAEQRDVVRELIGTLSRSLRKPD